MTTIISRALARGQKIIENIVNFSLPDPAGFIFAAAMLQIPNRVALFRMFLVARRGIDKAVSCSACYRRFVVIHANGAVRHILQKVKI